MPGEAGGLIQSCERGVQGHVGGQWGYLTQEGQAVGRSGASSQQRLQLKLSGDKGARKDTKVRENGSRDSWGATRDRGTFGGW